MDVHIMDTPALERVSPIMFRAYLESRGWVHEQTWRNRIMVWSNSYGGEAREALVPLREQSDVYAVRVSEAVTLLAEFEERSQLDIYYDLLGAGSDVIRLRPLKGSAQTGWDFSDSVDFLTRSRDLITAAARAAERPGQPVYRGRLSGEVTAYVRGVRPLLGPEAGPELTLHSPVPAEYGMQLDMGDPLHAPFSRRATIALNTGLREASEVLEAVYGGGQLSEVFGNEASKAVSANLCDAVAALARQGHGIGVGLSWAKVRPADAPSREFAFVESAADLFAEGAELLRRTNPFIDAHVTGEIVRLDRDSKEEFDGRSVVLHELDGRPVALHVQFDNADQDGVLRAFKNSIEISVDGDIHREGRTYLLKNPHNFVVLDAVP